MANDQLHRSDGALLLKKKRDLLEEWNRLTQQQLASQNLDNASNVVREKEQLLGQLQRLDTLLADWESTFSQENLVDEGLQSHIFALLQQIEEGEFSFAERLAKERNETIRELKTLQQQSSYGNPIKRPSPRHRKTVL